MRARGLGELGGGDILFLTMTYNISIQFFKLPMSLAAEWKLDWRRSRADAGRLLRRILQPRSWKQRFIGLDWWQCRWGEDDG